MGLFLLLVLLFVLFCFECLMGLAWVWSGLVWLCLLFPLFSFCGLASLLVGFHTDVVFSLLHPSSLLFFMFSRLASVSSWFWYFFLGPLSVSLVVFVSVFWPFSSVFKTQTYLFLLKTLRVAATTL